MNIYELGHTLMFSANAKILSNLQLVIILSAVAGLFFFEFTALSVLSSLVFFYLYSILGVSITLHRYYSHKAFEFRFSILKWISTAFALFSLRGSPLGWTYIHRLHHSFSDTEKDPHSPHHLGLKLFFLKDIDPHSRKMNIFLVKDMMNKEQLFINKNYFLFIIVWVAVLLILDPAVLYFLWILPAAIVHLSQAAFNYYAHNSGYRNNDSRDKSTNNIFLWPFIMGDAWHNNHHTNAGTVSTKQRLWEIDPASWIIGAIKK